MPGTSRDPLHEARRGTPPIVSTSGILRGRQRDAHRDDAARDRSPGSMAISRAKLRIIRPAPTSSMSASATWATTSAERSRRGRRQNRSARRPASARFSRSGLDARSAGTRPKMMPVAIDSTAAKASTRASTPTRSIRGTVVGRDATNSLDRPRSQQHAERAAGQRHHHALGQQLLHDAPPIGAERAAHRDLALPALRSREHQVGEVRARDQQDERHRAEQHEQRRPDVLHDLLVVRNHRRPRRRGSSPGYCCSSRRAIVSMSATARSNVIARLQLADGDTGRDARRATPETCRRPGRAAARRRSGVTETACPAA